MILYFDIGNTNVVFGVITREGEPKLSSRLKSDISKTSDEYALSILEILRYRDVPVSSIKAIMVSSVVPQITTLIEGFITTYMKDIFYHIVSVNSNHGLQLKIDNPVALGSDRLMSALAAYRKYKTNCITVDFGTANTMGVITKDGEFLGGTIFPGVKLALNSLHSGTAQLPMIDLHNPGKVVGTNTIKAIQSGIYYGYLSMLDNMINRVKKEAFSEKDDVKTVITGGLASIFYKDSAHDLIYEPDLIPYGLYYLYKNLKENK